jgi:hypothetical protein
MHSHGWNIEIPVTCRVHWANDSGDKGLIFYGIAQAHSSERSNLTQVTYEGYPESNLRFGIKKIQVKRNIFYYLNLKATTLNYQHSRRSN